MKLAGHEIDGPFTDPDDVKELPGVYVVLSLGTLDVGESGWRYREGGQGMRTRLRRHGRRPCWEEHRGTGDIAFAVLYEPDDDKRLDIEEAVRKHYDPPCSSLPLAIQ